MSRHDLIRPVLILTLLLALVLAVALAFGATRISWDDDMAMPVMDGPAAMRALRSICPTIPMVACSI